MLLKGELLCFLCRLRRDLTTRLGLFMMNTRRLRSSKWRALQHNWRWRVLILRCTRWVHGVNMHDGLVCNTVVGIATRAADRTEVAM
jgi:hypothetical protein